MTDKEKEYLTSNAMMKGKHDIIQGLLKKGE